MSDLFGANDDMDYWETMGQDEPVATAEPETPAEETPAVEDVSEERARDPETGRFVAREEQSEEEAPAEEETPAETPSEPELIGGKFKSQEALLEAYQNLERAKGARDNEVGELRRLIEERLPEPEEPTFDQETVATYFDENPTKISQIAAAAYQQGQSALMGQALHAWSEIDPAGAEQFRMDVARAEAVRAVQEQDTASEQTNRAYHSAAEAFAQQHPDFDNYAHKMREIAPEFPYLARLLETGDQRAVTETLSFLYREARDRESANRVNQARQVEASTAAEAAEAADRAIADAQVASASTAQPEPEKKNMADVIGDEWEAVVKPHTDGWNI